MDGTKNPTQVPFAFPLVVAKPSQPQVCLKTVHLLRALLKQAEVGEVNGIVVATLESDGAYQLLLEGEALNTNNQMVVLGMLTALQKTILDL